MPTNRRRKSRARRDAGPRVTPAMVSAFLRADSAWFHRTLGIPPWLCTPVEALGDCDCEPGIALHDSLVRARVLCLGILKALQDDPQHCRDAELQAEVVMAIRKLERGKR